MQIAYEKWLPSSSGKSYRDMRAWKRAGVKLMGQRGKTGNPACSTARIEVIHHGERK